MQDRFIRTAFGTIHAKIAGKGQPIILIHGYSPDVNSWRTWEKNIDALSTFGQVYALDLIGYGESDRPESRLDAPAQAAALIQLLDIENIPAADVVGLSWGGGVAQVVTGSVPHKIKRLVLVDSAYDESENGRARLHKIACPALIVWDEQDTVIPVYGAHYLARYIPNSQMRILTESERDPGANPDHHHWSQATHSIIWNQIVTAFLSE